MLRDLKNKVVATKSLAPAARTASANGASLDLLDYRSAVVLFDVGAYTNGSFTLKVQESDNDSSFTDVAAADQIGTLTAVTGAGQQNAVQAVGYIGSKRYIRAILEEGSSPAPGTGCVIGAVILGEPLVRPAA